MDIKIDCYNKTMSLQQMESNWKELLKDSHTDTIFLTWEWINTWWKVYGNKYRLYIVTVKDDSGHLIGIAPLKIAMRDWFFSHALPTLEFIGFGEDVTPEYLDFIVRKGYEKTVIPFLLRYLSQHCGCEVYNLRPFSSNSQNIPFIKNFFSEQKSLYEIRPHSNCPVVSLPNTWDDFVSNRSKNFRKKMKEYSRICVRDFDLKFTKCTSLGKLEDRLTQLVGLHHNRWNNSSQAFKSAEYINFHRQISTLFLKRGWLRLYFLADGEKPIAGIYCYYYNNQFYYYQSGRDICYSKYRVGLVLINKVIEEAINEGAVLFDFLSGDESYKFRWAQGIRRNSAIMYWNSAHNYLFSWSNFIARSIFRKVSDALKRR